MPSPPPTDTRRPPTRAPEKLEKAENAAAREPSLPTARPRDRQAPATGRGERLLHHRAEPRGVVQQAHALHRAAGNQAVLQMLDERDAPATEWGALEATRARIGEDAHEREAARIGELVARAPAAEPVRGLSQAMRRARAAPPSVVPDGMPPGVRRALEAPGRPLDAATRRALPPGLGAELGVDLSAIRVHVGDAAARSADALGAEAYTVGRDIVFGAGRFAPHTAVGRGLLAHEVAHAGQQAAGAVTGRVQRQPKDEPPAIKQYKFTVPVPHAMEADEFAEWVVQQYFGASRAEIGATLGVSYTMKRGTTAEEVAKKQATILVPVLANDPYDKLPKEEKDKIDAEVNKRFTKRTKRDPSTLSSTPADRALSAQKQHMRDELLMQRAQIASLPDDIKAALFSGGPDDKAVSPEDYSHVLRIARKLALLTPAQRQDYLARVNHETTSLSAMESSVDAFIEFQKQREAEAVRQDEAAKPLLGTEDLYTLYRRWRAAKSTHSLGQATKGAAKDKTQAAESMEMLGEQLATAEAALLAALEKKGFKSIAEFETAIENYRVAFRSQAVTLALDVIARYEHMLFVERKKFQAAGSGAALVQGIAAADAPAKYVKARAAESEAQSAQTAVDPMEKGPNKARDQAEVARRQAAARSARAEAHAAVVSGSGNDPIVARGGVDPEKLAGLDAAAAQAYMLETIEKRTENARKAKEEFIEDPDRVFKLDDLVKATFTTQEIEPDSVYGRIVADHIADEKQRHLLSALAVGVLAIALAILVPGGGWLAAAALVAGAGISTYQALEAIKEYQAGQADYHLGFLQEEPSLIWVGIAIVGAAADLGAATGAIVKASKVFADSAKGLKTLEDPLRAFAKGELTAETLLAKIEKAEGLDAAVKAAMARELKLSQAAKAAFRETLGHAMSPGSLAGAANEAAKSFFRALYYSVRRGTNTIVKLRKDKELATILGDLTHMTGAEMTELKAAFEEVKELAKAGQAKGMDDAALVGFVDRWALNRGTPGFKPKLLDEIKIWKPLTAEQKQKLTALEEAKGLLATMNQEKREALEEIGRLRAQQASPATKSAENAARIKELEKDLTKLDPNWDVAKPKVKGEGDIAKQQGILSAAEEEARKAQVTLYDRLRAAAPSEAAREGALKGATADQVGALKTAATPLQAEHIVSVREISDMEGFSKLPWQDQKAIVDMKQNLVAMDGAANASKGGRTWGNWPQASNFYEKSTIEAMIKREADVRAAIQAAIREKLPKGAVK